MYITADTIINIAAVFAALSTIVGAIVAVYKTVERDSGKSRALALHDV